MSNKENEVRQDIFDEEDELSALFAPDQTTPQQSLGSQHGSSAKPTPYANLRQLAGLIRKPSTPGRRKSSNSLVRTQTSATPGSQRRQTPGIARALQPTTGNRSNPATPHAVRALAQRRNTPGFERRKSGRVQRETPRDILRNLSKVLTKTTQKGPSPLSQPDENQAPMDDGSEDELSPDQPSITLPIQEEEESFDAPPPRLSMPLDENDLTSRSVELGRREPARDTLTRGGLRGLRASEVFPTTEASEIVLQKRPTLPEEDELDELSGLDFANQSGDTENLRKLMLRRSLGQTTQLEGDTSSQIGDDDSRSPFVLQIPDFAPRQSDITERRQTAPRLDESFPIFEEGGAEDEDILQSAIHTSPFIVSLPLKRRPIVRARKPRVLQKSRFGIEYSNIPLRVTKAIANASARNLTKRKTKLSKETVAAIREAGNQFLAQLGDDLRTFSRHADRLKVEEADIFAAMVR